MKSFPMFIRTTGRCVTIVGGGEQAAQKARLILKTDARILLVAPELEPELQALVAEGRARHQHRLTPEVFADAAMGFIATGCPAFDASAHALARAMRCPVNVVDRPDLCDLTTPALVDRDPVVIAIGSEGTAPVLTREIKTRLEEMLSPSLGGLAALAGRLRPMVNARVPSSQRRAFWAWVFKGAPRATWARGGEREAAQAIKSAIASGGAPNEAGHGHVALVGAGPGARDLLTLRAVERLQEADVIFYDRLVDPEVLELARRDAERVFVGKHVGAHSWPQDRINAVILAAARQGKRVVRLKSGDPGVFGRAGEEIAVLRAAGIAVELVPGITAASAAAAALGEPLTERGISDTLILTTGMSREGAALPDSTRHAAPGTTSAFYMSVRQAARIRDDLMARGMPPQAPVRVAIEVSKPGEHLLTCPLVSLEESLQEVGCKGCAVILVTWPEAAVPAAPAAETCAA
ncbi:siroheme synthase CysG [Mameliella alba]|uniref:siroheme synthase CysG n=1 Tax=Mameliella alba TaxID=561184 RepID=UPI000B531CA8|nr:siroheme synthase CysG [Mameliella alba]MBY6117625.1 siroheme synthase CysG [Mameliella alba]OWV44575.1 uroporphyrinogen-III C-methyltransferase [Mameliella alba]OWV65014.1 uroporphyrinogen-III C-methyltransferase [Mameliella alba]